MTNQKSEQNRRHRVCLKKLVFVICLAVMVVVMDHAKAQPPITALAFSKDYKHVIAGSQLGILIEDWPGLGGGRTMHLEMNSIHDVAFSPDGSHLLIAGGSPGVVGVVQLRRWPNLELVRSWSEHQDVVYAIAWRGDGKEWVSASWDGYCRVCKTDALASHLTMSSHSGPIFAAKYLPGGQIASAGTDRTIVVWDSSSGLPSKILRQHTATVHALACQTSEAAKVGEPLLASAGEDRTVRFWQPSLGRMVRFQRFKSTPRSIAWTMDGRWLMVGCDDGRVFQLDPIQLTTEELMLQNTSVFNLAVDMEGVIGLSNHAAIKKIDKRR